MSTTLTSRMMFLARAARMCQVRGMAQTTTATATATAAKAVAASSVQGLSAALKEKFDREGFLVLPSFYDIKACKKLDGACEKLIENFDPSQHPLSIFSTIDQTKDDYFLDSGHKIRYFFEENAFSKDGKLVVPLNKSLNKIGHALHELEPSFKEFTKDPRHRAIAKSLGLVNPVIAQSMFIFKQPGIGGLVVPHQDSTFLYTNPMTTIGFWIPLQECTKSNGCLWAIPGSHKKGLYNNRRMVRVIKNGKVDIEFTGPEEKFSESDFVPLEIPAGSLVLIHGEVVHKSNVNASPISRHAYTFHVIDGNHVYDEKNWLQPGKFPPL